MEFFSVDSAAIVSVETEEDPVPVLGRQREHEHGYENEHKVRVRVRVRVRWGTQEWVKKSMDMLVCVLSSDACPPDTIRGGQID